MAEENALLEPDQNEEPTIPTPTEPEPESEPVREEPQPPTESKNEFEDKYNNVRTALREERQTKSQLQQQLGDVQQRLQGMESLRDELNTYRQSRQQNEQQDKFNDDPANYLKQKVDELDQKQQDLVNQSQQANQEALAFNNEMNAIRSQTSQYAQQNPDYNERFNFVQNRRMKEFELLGVPQESWQAQLENESIQLARVAMQQGRNPAELLSELATHWGYQGQTAPESPNQETNEQNLTRLEQGQKAASTLSSGGQSDDSLLKSVERMSDDEFDKFWDTEVKPTYR
jgi:predicted  nucleic acid-binding Zn-ribbon protein